MKKIFTLLVLALVTLTTQAAITVHVKADAAPYLWAWTAAGNVFSEAWPGPVLTQKKTVQGTEFWYYTFAADITNVNILFNNGEGKQTGDINGITTDRYFTYDGATSYTDVTEQYGGTVPDAEVNTLGLAGNHNGWGADDFSVVEAGKSFAISVDLSAIEIEDNYWKFKIRPNKADWVGYSQVTITNQPEWLEQAMSDDNFQVDLENITAENRKFTLTASWAGGKDATAGWTFGIAQATSGIRELNGTAAQANAPVYNLQGQRVASAHRGLYIQNGRKYLVK